jgi:surface-anchored protein
MSCIYNRVSFIPEIAAMRKPALVLIAALTCVAATIATPSNRGARAATVLSSGHVDIFEAEYEELIPGSPELHLGVHNDDGHFEPGDVILLVKREAYTNTTGLPSTITDILGANAWILPADTEAANALGVIEAGIGRVGEFPDASAVTFTLLAAGESNPGNFVLFNPSNTIRLSTAGTNIRTSSFGLTLSHLHWNWGFSAPGTYTFDMQASYLDPDAGLLLSPVETYTFEVQAVPEPSAIALVTLGFIGLGGTLLRQRRQGNA